MGIRAKRLEERKAADMPEAPGAEWDRVEAMVRSCIQCGTCTGSCPNAASMDLTPRQLWRHVLLGRRDAVFQSRTFTLCSACYLCTLRCPRGLSLTEAMQALKQAAARARLKRFRPVSAFYRQFLKSVRRHGRVRELEFMSLYFAEMMNPLLPLRYASLGLRLARKGRLGIGASGRRRRPLEALFRKARELEEGP
jgi:heterodisulfide reductase subunit C